MTTLRTQIKAHDRRLDTNLRRRVGITVETYKALTFGFRAIGLAIFAAVAIYPSVTLTATQSLVLGALVLGPDVAEAYLARGE